MRPVIATFRCATTLLSRPLLAGDPGCMSVNVSESLSSSFYAEWCAPRLRSVAAQSDDRQRWTDRTGPVCARIEPLMRSVGQCLSVPNIRT